MMNDGSTRKKILDKIKAALAKPTPPPFPEQPLQQSVFQPRQDDPVVLFAERFTSLGGKFVFCVDRSEFAQQITKLVKKAGWEHVYCAETAITSLLPGVGWHGDISTCDVSLTTCERLVARTGSMVLSSAAGRVPSVYAPVHICVAYTSQLAYDIGDAISATQQKYGRQLPSFITLATGPSRTADIEKTLVVGVHGPKEVYCFLIDDEA
jgi:L-lactate dehydrogenase complex protein LldG